jgi:hypothetical protein
MNKLLLSLLLLGVGIATTQAQVDVAQRRTLSLQMSHGVHHSDEAIGGFAYLWFNENDWPIKGTALRVVFAGVYGDAELSWFLPGSTNTSVGIGLEGGAFLGGVTPYWRGEQIEEQSFYGDMVGGRVFLNQQIPNPTPIPINLRGTYGLNGQFYRDTTDTANFDAPPNFLLQSLQAELRIGGVLPGLNLDRALELYLLADVNFRTGFHAFGPVGSRFPSASNYERFLASATVRWPFGPVVGMLRICGGTGNNLDELSAWSLGGNLLQVGRYSQTLHGYYVREFLAKDFLLVNSSVSMPLGDWRELTGHLYLDHATARLLDPRTGVTAGWRDLTGLGAGLSLKAWWDTTVLLSYGYGFQAVRNENRGGHEIGFALEKKF